MEETVKGREDFSPWAGAADLTTAAVVVTLGAEGVAADTVVGAATGRLTPDARAPYMMTNEPNIKSRHL
jgi:hypothetical protein